MSLHRVYHDALNRILSLAQDDEGGDMIPPILDAVRLALNDGKTWAEAEDERTQARLAGIDLTGRPA